MSRDANADNVMRPALIEAAARLIATAGAADSALTAPIAECSFHAKANVSELLERALVGAPRATCCQGADQTEMHHVSV